MKKLLPFLFLFVLLSGVASALMTTSDLFRGVIAYYPLSNDSLKNSTYVRDYSPNGYHGAITKGSGGFASDRYGQSLKAYDFDGANTKIDTGSDWIGTQAITISAWIYARSWGEAPTGFTNAILNNGKFFILFYNPVAEGAKRVRLSSNGSTLALAADNSFSLNKWYHVAVTRSTNGTANFYVNGVLSGTANQASGTPVAGTTNVIIGNNNGQTATFDGTIDEVFVWNRVLSASEVKQLYELYNPKVSSGSLYSGLIYDAPLNNLSIKGGSTINVTDKSPNRYNGNHVNVSFTSTYGLFDGQISKIDTQSDWIGTQAISVSAWIYARSYGEGNVGTIVDNGKFEFRRGSLGGDSWVIRSDGATSATVQIEALNIWQHVVVTRTSAGVANFYINGYLSGTANQDSGTPVAGTTNVIIGNRNGQDRTFDGYISKVKVWNRVLSTSEAKLDFQRTCGVYQACT